MNGRIQKIQELLQKDEVDGALYATSGNMQYFLHDTAFWWQRTPDTGGFVRKGEGGKGPLSSLSGHSLNKPDCVLYIPAEGEPLLVATYERARDMGGVRIPVHACYYVQIPEVLSSHLRGGRIACGESCGQHLRRMVSGMCPGAEIVDGEGYGERLRSIKEEGEIEILRKLAAFTDGAMAAVVPEIKPGVTPAYIEHLLSEFGRERNVPDLPFAPACICVRTGAPGSDSIGGHPKDSPIEKGTAVTFDFGYVMDGYCSDFGRAFYCGVPDDTIAGAYRALQEAQCSLLETIKPGMRMDLTFRTLFSSLEKHGLGKYLRNYGLGLMGHQIGIDVHERPWLSDEADEIFEPGMVMCIEPKIWYPGKGYLRVEDMVLITKDGCESLTKFDRELFELQA